MGLPLCRPGRCGLRFRSGRCCREHRRCGDHVHCCKGTAGARTRFWHNPLAEEFARILSSAGRFVELELRDPTMGPHARLDIVEFASAVGALPPTMCQLSLPSANADGLWSVVPARLATPRKRAMTRNLTGSTPTA